MAKKKVFVSFDYETDRYYKYLLDAWDANKNMDFAFNDCSSDEIHSEIVSVVKAALTRRIKSCTYTLVIVGKHSNNKHADSEEIGHKNWQNFEIAKSVEYNNKVAAIKIDRSNVSPEELLGIGASWAMSFTQDTIIEALNNA